MLRRTLLPLLLGIALVPAAAAQSVQNVLAEAGVLGLWANDCSRPSGGGNIHTTYAVEPSGAVTLSYAHGGPPTVNEILSATRVAADKVGYRQQNRQNGTKIEIVLTVTPTHIRVHSSQRESGEFLVQDGKFTSDGVESPLQAKCPAPSR